MRHEPLCDTTEDCGVCFLNRKIMLLETKLVIYKNKNKRLKQALLDVQSTESYDRIDFIVAKALRD